MVLTFTSSTIPHRSNFKIWLFMPVTLWNKLVVGFNKAYHKTCRNSGGGGEQVLLSSSSCSYYPVLHMYVLQLQNTHSRILITVKPSGPDFATAEVPSSCPCQQINFHTSKRLQTNADNAAQNWNICSVVSVFQSEVLHRPILRAEVSTVKLSFAWFAESISHLLQKKISFQLLFNWYNVIILVFLPLT